MLDMIINNDFLEPYNKFPPESHIPILNKTVVKSKLSNKFSMILQPLEHKFLSSSQHGKTMSNIMNKSNSNTNSNILGATGKQDSQIHTKENNTLSQNMNVEYEAENERINRDNNYQNNDELRDDYNEMNKNTAKFNQEPKVSSQNINFQEEDDMFYRFQQEMLSIEPSERLVILEKTLQEKTAVVELLLKQRENISNFIEQTKSELLDIQNQNQINLKNSANQQNTQGDKSQQYQKQKPFHIGINTHINNDYNKSKHSKNTSLTVGTTGTNTGKNSTKGKIRTKIPNFNKSNDLYKYLK